MQLNSALFTPAPLLSRRSVRVDHAEQLVIALAIGFVLTALAGFVLTGHQYDNASLTSVWAGTLIVISAGAVIGRQWSDDIGLSLRYWGYFFAISILGSLNGSLLASAAMPLVDSQLLAADQLIGFDWRTTFLAVHRKDTLLMALSVAYSTLAWQPVVLIGVLAIGRHHQIVRTFVLAWGFALAVTLAISPFTPALGNFLYHGVAQADYPAIRVTAAWTFAENFAAMRSGSAQLITRESLDGLVTFPSFHTSGAVLLAIGWSAVRRASVPFCLLNAAMIISAIVIGGHYLVDVLAGIVIAMAAWAAAAWAAAAKWLEPKTA